MKIRAEHLLVIVIVAFVIGGLGFWLGYSAGRRSPAQLAEQSIVPLGQQERTAVTGTASELQGDQFVVIEDGSVDMPGFHFRLRPETVIGKLLPIDNTESQDTLEILFSFTGAPAVFSDIKLGDRVYVQADQALDPDKTMNAVEIKIQQ